jgi:cytochrome c-type biogenesis protein
MVKRWAVFSHGVLFVLGFSFVFVFIIGISAGLIGQFGTRVLRAQEWILRIGGLLVIVLGLHTMGVIRIPFLYYDTRKQQAPRKELGYGGSFLMGVTFAAGWSPCVGPILGGILTLGASTGSVGQAVVLLVVYALGLAIPFLAAALALDQATTSIRKIQKHMQLIEIAGGILLILIGFVIIAGTLKELGSVISTQRLAVVLGGGSATDIAVQLDEWLVNQSGGNTLSIPLAFLAGLFSFLSPCVLPLVPAYIGYLTGQAANTLSEVAAQATTEAAGQTSTPPTVAQEG